MKFQRLLMENFSSYYKKHEIIFNNTLEKPITIIVGGSGKGKTSVFDAINWALYGQQYELVLLKDSEKEIVDYVNETAQLEAIKLGESVEMACTLSFEHEDINYRIQQALCVFPNDNRIEITDRTTSLYRIHSTGNSEEIIHIESFLNEILPSNVRDYFLFNGDRINKLALPGSSEQIRDGIYRVVDLELFQNGAKHLEEVAKKFRKITKSNSFGEIADVEKEYSDAYEQINELKERSTNYTNEKRALEDKIEVVSDKLRSMDEVKDLQKRRDVLKERYQQLQSNLKQIKGDLRSATATAVLRFAFPDIEVLRTSLNEKRSKGEIPSSISENLLRDILEMGKCICGTDFEEGDHVYTQLKNRLNHEKEKQKQGNNLLDLFFELGSAKSDIDKSLINLPKLEDQRVLYEQRLIEINNELGEILQKLINQPEEEIKKLASNLQEFNRELIDVGMNISTCNRRISSKEEEIRILENKRNELGIKQEKVRKYQLRDSLAQKASIELQRIFEKFAEDSRLEVQELTRDEFNKFIPTASALEVGINPEFHYDVRDQAGNPALQQLSNGQKQALSLAYITSISRVSEKNPPLVIDMPFGRLDKDVQDNIAQRLPELAAQVILLVLPGAEWNEHIEAILGPRISDIYYLNFEDKLRQTTIMKKEK